MGNAQESFQKKPIEKMSIPMSDYVNRCLEIYQQETGCDTTHLWDNVCPSFINELNTDTFKKIQQLDPILQEGLLTQSFGNIPFQPFDRFKTGDKKSIKLLEDWDNCGVFEKIHDLFKDKNFNNILNFEAIKIVNTFICIPFQSDANICVTIQFYLQ